MLYNLTVYNCAMKNVSKSVTCSYDYVTYVKSRKRKNIAINEMTKYNKKPR